MGSRDKRGREKRKPKRQQPKPVSSPARPAPEYKPVAPPPPKFGKRIRALRKGRGWTQVYMAEHVGMDRSFISDLENGRKEICIRNLELLATAFSVTISKLMSRL